LPILCPAFRRLVAEARAAAKVVAAVEALSLLPRSPVAVAVAVSSQQASN
jgi:hypothetical protein